MPFVHSLLPPHHKAKPLHMKKFRLSISSPCHENWEAMKPEDKGRFCGSCQKTVIDFTGMSDRQMAEFFKKPATSLCGRFHADQLERAIDIPKKRIPWVKYFFTVAWPAFILMLKGCGQKNDVTGEPVAKERINKKAADTTFATMGMFLQDIKPVDSPSVATKVKKTTAIDTPSVVGELHVSGAVMGDTAALPAVYKIDTVVTESKTSLDTVNVVGYRPCERSVIMGGLSISRSVAVRENVPLTETPEQKTEAVAYPNPVRAGGRVTVSLLSGDDGQKQVQLFSPSGALMKWQEDHLFKNGKLILTVPSSAASGTYFLRIVSQDRPSSTVKIVVLN